MDNEPSQLPNLFTLPALPADGAEHVVSLLARPGLRIERIVSRGQCSPEGFWYDQDEHEWVLLLQGEARLEREEGGVSSMVDLKPGDHLLLPAHCRHRVAWTAHNAATVWLAVFWQDELP